MSEDNKPTITPAPNGPYIVKGVSRCSNRHGSVEAGETMALCRCGASNNKPFCDGTHRKIGFSSDKLEGRLEDKMAHYEGKKITIHDNRSACAHAGYCTDNLASVFRMKQEPWIDPDGADVEAIIEVVRSCPSGALGYSIDGESGERSAGEPSIHIAPDGPYEVTGDVELADTEWAEGVPRTRFTLCRCGGSKNKPFCDGTHWYIEFSDDKN